MAKTSAIIGKGTTIGKASSSGGSYTSLAEVTDVKPPTLSVGKVEATHYTSDNDFLEWLSAVWQEAGDVTMTLNYVKATTTTLYDIVGDPLWWKITLPDASTIIFPGFLSSLGQAVPNKEKISQDVSITVTGPVTFAAGA